MRKPPLRLVLHDEIGDGARHGRLGRKLQEGLEIEGGDGDGHALGVRARGIEPKVGVNVHRSEDFAEAVDVGKPLSRQAQRLAVFHRETRLDAAHFQKVERLCKLQGAFFKRNVGID